MDKPTLPKVMQKRIHVEINITVPCAHCAETASVKLEGAGADVRNFMKHMFRKLEKEGWSFDRVTLTALCPEHTKSCSPEAVAELLSQEFPSGDK